MLPSNNLSVWQAKVNKPDRLPFKWHFPIHVLHQNYRFLIFSHGISVTSVVPGSNRSGEPTPPLTYSLNFLNMTTHSGEVAEKLRLLVQRVSALEVLQWANLLPPCYLFLTLITVKYGV